MEKVKVRVAIDDEGRWVILETPPLTKENRKLIKKIKAMKKEVNLRIKKPQEIYSCDSGVYDVIFRLNENEQAVAAETTKQYETTSITITIAIGEDGEWVNLTAKEKDPRLF